MAGPNLEIFRFGFYMFFPIYIMFKFGDPIWYDTYVVPYKEMFWPPYETTHQTPKTQTDLREELARMKAERIARKSALTGHPTISASIPTSTDNQESPTGEATSLPTISTATPQTLSSESNGIGATSGATRWKWPGSGSSSESSGRVV